MLCLTPFMFNHYYTLRLVAASLDREFSTARIEEIFTQEKNEVVFLCSRDGEKITMQFSSDGRWFHLLRRDNFHRAKKNSVDVFSDAVGSVINKIFIDGHDRFITIMLSNGNHFLAQLLPGRANIFLSDSSQRVLDSFKTYRSETTELFSQVNRSRHPVNDPDIAKIRESAVTLADLKIICSSLGKTLFNELLSRAQLDRSDPTHQFDQDEIELISTQYFMLQRELQTPIPRLYYEGDSPVRFSLIPLHSLTSHREEIFDDIHTALNTFLRKHHRHERLTAHKQRVLRGLEKYKTHVFKSLHAMESESEIRERASIYERYGDLLMSALYEKPQQPNLITLADIFSEQSQTIDIPLAPELTLPQNAQRYFAKAKHCKASIAHVRSRKEKLDRTIKIITAAIDEVERCLEYSELKKYISSNKKMLQSFGLREQGEKETKPFPFRRFVVTGGFEVWAGKSSVNNDELTLHAADKNDLWFHARGVGGSHVILKVGSAAGQVSKESIRDAASIAAYYSKARKAKSVAIAYTEKKYVRKPKGVPAGTVVIEHEKVILVEPKLPKHKDNDE